MILYFRINYIANSTSVIHQVEFRNVESLRILVSFINFQHQSLKIRANSFAITLNEIGPGQITYQTPCRDQVKTLQTMLVSKNS